MVSMVVEAVKPEIEPSLDPAYMDSQLGFHQQEVQSTLKLVQLVFFGSTTMRIHQFTPTHRYYFGSFRSVDVAGLTRLDTRITS